jgi:transposase-like protein
MSVCKKCQSSNIVKNGFVRSKQRYHCKDCEYNFVERDNRVSEATAVKRALAVIMYSLGKASLGFIGKLLGVHKTTVLKWIKKEGELLKDPEISSEITEIEIDEMWHFLKKSQKRNGSSKPWIVIPNEQLPGLQVVVMLKQSKNFTKN